MFLQSLHKRFVNLWRVGKKNSKFFLSMHDERPKKDSGTTQTLQFFVGTVLGLREAFLDKISYIFIKKRLLLTSVTDSLIF
jgi:hypothetical protein